MWSTTNRTQQADLRPTSNRRHNVCSSWELEFDSDADVKVYMPTILTKASNPTRSAEFHSEKHQLALPSFKSETAQPCPYRTHNVSRRLMRLMDKKINRALKRLIENGTLYIDETDKRRMHLDKNTPFQFPVAAKIHTGNAIIITKQKYTAYCKVNARLRSYARQVERET